ncbi:thioredoxin family protein [Patescibacteria group bacterium]|nr:thioredoxin family protein [Patescibacteria group bacterium]MBU1911016.1 thioredoxin family protein [Patescibacteria group bacterium]
MQDVMSTSESSVALKRRAIVSWLRTRCKIKVKELDRALLAWAIKTIMEDPGGNIEGVLESLGRRISAGKEDTFRSEFVPDLIQVIEQAGSTSEKPTAQSSKNTSAISKKMRIAIFTLISSAVALGAGHATKKSMQSVDEVTDSTFDDVTEGSWLRPVVVVDFNSDYCGPCRKMKPIIEDLAREYAWRVRFVSANTKENATNVKKYEVKCIPHFVVLKDGEQVDELIGGQERERVEEVVEEALGE